MSLAIDDQMAALTFPQGVIYASMKDTLCTDAGCLTRVGPDVATDLTVWDYGHLTVSGAKFTAQTLVEPVLANMLGTALAR